MEAPSSGPLRRGEERDGRSRVAGQDATDAERERAAAKAELERVYQELQQKKKLQERAMLSLLMQRAAVGRAMPTARSPSPPAVASDTREGPPREPAQPVPAPSPPAAQGVEELRQQLLALRRWRALAALRWWGTAMR